MRRSIGIFYVGLIVIAGLFASAAWSGDWDPEKEFGIKFDKVVQGSDPIEPGKAESSGEVTSRRITGTLFILNNTVKVLSVARGSQGGNWMGYAPPLTLSAFPVWDPSGGTYFWACTSTPPNGTCYRKSLDDSWRTIYKWVIP